MKKYNVLAKKETDKEYRNVAWFEEHGDALEFVAALRNNDKNIPLQIEVRPDDSNI